MPPGGRPSTAAACLSGTRTRMMSCGFSTISCPSRSAASAGTLHLFGLRYWDDILSPWAGRLDRRLRVKYDPRDLSCVFVEGPDGVHWPVRFADLRRPRITLGEHRLAMAALRQRGVRLTDEQLIFDTVEAQRALLETAASATRSARRQLERGARSLAAGDQRVAANVTEVSSEGASESLPVLAVKEWS